MSWDSLRAKSVSNLGKPSELVNKRYLRADPEEDPYLREVRPSSKLVIVPKPLEGQEAKGSRVRQIEKKIKELESQEQAKNNKILRRIEKKI